MAYTHDIEKLVSRHISACLSVNVFRNCHIEATMIVCSSTDGATVSLDSRDEEVLSSGGFEIFFYVLGPLASHLGPF